MVGVGAEHEGHGTATTGRGGGRPMVVVLAALAVMAAVVVGVALVVGGDDAGDDDAGNDERREAAAGEETDGPVIPSAAGPPGTALGDGFTVIEGTVLIGDPIPTGDALDSDTIPRIDEGWTATLLVDGGDPEAIVEEYLRQAEEIGLARDGGTPCRQDVQDARVVVCVGFARSADRSEPRSLSVRTVRGRRTDVVSDHVVVQYSTHENAWRSGNQPAIDDGDPAALEPPAEWPSRPTVGDALPSANEITSVIPIQEDSRVAGPVRLNLDDTTGGIVATLEVTGDPGTVFQAYLDVLAAQADWTRGPDERKIGDATLTQARAGVLGGDSIQLRMVERPGRPVWLVIDGIHD